MFGFPGIPREVQRVGAVGRQRIPPNGRLFDRDRCTGSVNIEWNQRTLDAALIRASLEERS